MKQIIIVTGMSGAGKTTVLNVFEDIGFEVIDNLPLSLLPSITAEITDSSPLAIGIDARTRDFNPERLMEFYTEIKKNKNVSEQIIFLDCDDEKLLRRFTETRRSHPLAKDKSLREGIFLERRLMLPLKEHSDIIIDTTDMKVSGLRHEIEAKFKTVCPKEIVVSVMSFSFREGLPREADLVFDVRFLRNPYYEPDLRPLTGKDAAISKYVSEDPDYPGFFKRLTEFLEPLFPRFLQEGKSHLTIAIGCTGGQHRSVFTAEELYKWLLSKKECIVTLTHRELEKNK